MSEQIKNVTNDETVDCSSTVSNISKQPKKRGRKPNPNKKVYFGEEEEKAFVEYLNSTDQNYRDKIFAEKLY